MQGEAACSHPQADADDVVRVAEPNHRARLEAAEMPAADAWQFGGRGLLAAAHGGDQEKARSGRPESITPA